MVFDKLKQQPKQKTLIRTMIITFIPFIVLTIAFVLNELILISTTGYGILHFEIAGTPEMVIKIFNAWGPDKMRHQAFMHYVDYAYIPFYGLFGTECILFVSRKFKGKVQDLGFIMTLFPLIAGTFDVIENVNLLLMLNDETYITSGCSFFALLFAILKIGFLIACLCFFYITIFLLALGRNDRNNACLYFTLFGGAIIIFGLLLTWETFLALLTGIIFSILVYYMLLQGKRDAILESN